MQGLLAGSTLLELGQDNWLKLRLFAPDAKAAVREFDWDNLAAQFFIDNALWLGIAVGSYLPIVFGLKRVMRSREPFGLRLPLILWNIFLAVFSLCGAIGTVTYLTPPLLAGDVCTTNMYYHQVIGPWIFLFCLSKVFEFVDTFFLCLRKRPVIFLHWYHHVATMLYCWQGAITGPMYHGVGLYFGAMNLCVHAIMYSYYAIRACGIRVPKVIAKQITTLQIAQMIAGTGLVIYSKVGCPDSGEPLWVFSFGAIMYTSYWYLFAQMYYKRYRAAAQKRAARKTADANNNVVPTFAKKEQ